MDGQTHGFRATLIALTLTALSTLSGCGLVPWMAHAIGGGERTVQVEAQYEGLANQSVAVMVAAADTTLFQYPKMTDRICKSVSQRLNKHIEGVTLMNPEQVLSYQSENPYWHTLRYSRLIERMGVDRIVLVDIVDYRTHEPGNKHVYKGVATANIGVIEAQAADPDNFAFHTTVTTEFPDDTKVGLVNGDQQTLALALTKRFSRRVGWLFYDHEETR